MRYRYMTADVFTDRRFSGNQLAVLPEADGLPEDRMQAVAAEFNYSETVFVLPPEEPAHLAKLRIFTPKAEVPFAGHPTVGTALLLARLGRSKPTGGRSQMVLEELAGPVPVTLTWESDQPARAEFTAPAKASIGPAPEAGVLAGVLGLAVEDLVIGSMPCKASCGNEFLIVEVATLEALGRASDHGIATQGSTGVLVVTRQTNEAAIDWRARMFAPQHGIVEDPATGSAAAAFAGALALTSTNRDGSFRWRIAQGIEMGRPSLIEASAEKRAGQVTAVRIAGQAVQVMEGWLEL